MDKEYVQRRTPAHSSGKKGKYSRKKSGPPPFLILALILIIVVVAVVLIAVFFGREGQSDKEPVSSSSEVSSQLSEVESSTGSSVAEPISSQVSSTLSSSATPPPEKTPQGEPEQLDFLLKIGDTGYEYYNFVEEYANQYITTVCDLGESLSGATLYSMIIPTSMDILLSEDYIESHGINSTNQKKAIEYMVSSINAINSDVKTVPLFDALKLHNNEYLYFRTDHHWTQLGAYYAYVEFCEAKGVQAVSLDQFDKKEYTGFLGSFYNDDPNSEMESNPDTVEAYFPRADTTLSFTDADGLYYADWPLIADGDTYDSANLYYIFCAADQPYEEIVNSDLNDGSACVVIKESFGNVFIPFLVNHYQTVYVVDYRYYNGDIPSLVSEKNISDVILLNNISMTRNEELIEDLQNLY